MLHALRTAIGDGPRATRERDLGSTQLAPYLVALAFPFLVFVLLQRHLPDVFRQRLERGTTPA
jgi:hypothetical protein